MILELKYAHIALLTYCHITACLRCFLHLILFSLQVVATYHENVRAPSQWHPSQEIRPEFPAGYFLGGKLDWPFTSPILVAKALKDFLSQLSLDVGTVHLLYMICMILRCFHDSPPQKKTRRPSSKKHWTRIFPRCPWVLRSVLKNGGNLPRSFSSQVGDPPSHVNAGLHPRCPRTSKHDGSPTVHSTVHS